jgi:hypothetical protein
MQQKNAEAAEIYRRSIQIGELARAREDAMNPVLTLWARLLESQGRAAEARAIDRRMKESLLRKAEGELPAASGKQN